MDWFALRRLKLSVAASVKLTRSRPEGPQPLVALLVERESRVLGSVTALDPRHHLLRTGHLRDRV
jgi:hypothetical protein